VVAYATVSEDKTLAVTLINKSHGAGAKEQTVQIVADGVVANSPAQVIFLRGKNDDISGGSDDVTLGDAPIAEDGGWSGRWTALPASAVVNNAISVTMPPASAAVVKVALR
jgi:hypothetical protein